MNSISHFNTLTGDKQYILTWTNSIRHGGRGLKPKATYRIENSEVPCFTVIIIFSHLEGTLKMSHQGYVESQTLHFHSSFFFSGVIDNCSFVILCLT